jgi:hypothetical protein
MTTGSRPLALGGPGGPTKGVIQLSAPSLFRSKYAAYRVKVRSERKVWNAGGTAVIETIPEIVAEFAQHLGEFDYQDETGMPRRGADIRGHFFDLDVAAEVNGWSDEDKELVRKVLLMQCKKTPADVWVHETAKPQIPWPTYDSTHHNKIPVLAEELGLIGEAIAYEAANKNRDSVVAALEERRRVHEAAEELTAA